MKGAICVVILFFLILATISHANKFSKFGKFIKGKANKVGQSIKTQGNNIGKAITGSALNLKKKVVSKSNEMKQKFLKLLKIIKGNVGDIKTTVAAVSELKKACKQKEFKNMIRLYYKLQDQEIPAIIQLFGC